jgi:2,3-dihydroxybenzoate-AMP ligase
LNNIRLTSLAGAAGGQPVATGDPKGRQRAAAIAEAAAGGGARLSATLAARIPAEIGCQLQQVFGMAEGW